ncbi:aldo/keto reductase [Steroidobacter cummioxidans]|uniref:aldo/keto reductase n=1 Tax=Steroidobacter cummioxidans TaxID=1803913 RepID=UPI000E30FF24|nr:aldo/keto reductase [Steroidobacter cummioxidans]
MISRRDYLQLSALAGVSLAVNPTALLAAGQRSLITRAIPGTSEQLPVVGLGSSASFARIAGAGDTAAIKALLDALSNTPNAVFDTAPSYGSAEEVAASVARQNGHNKKLFWATKVNVAGSGGSADPAAARAQLDRSIERLGKSPVDLIQVHNMADIPTQLGLLKEYRDAGRVRYIGVTTTNAGQYELLERVMREEKLNFIGVDYAIDNRTMEERIFPLAKERGIGVLVYQPFGRTRLWQKVEGHELPGWAAEYDIATWGQFFLKFAVSHPAVTAATPATSSVRNLADNLGAATGRLPDDAGRRRMIAHIESL